MPDVATFKSKDGQVLRTRIPGAYSFIKTLTEGATFATTNNVVLIGAANGGDPYVLNYYRDADKARIMLQGGSLLTAVTLALSPNSVNVPEKIGVLRANSALKATRVANQGVTAVWTFEAVNAGTLGNAIKTMIEAGATVGKKISIQNGATVTFSQDDMTNPIFEIEYTGTGTIVTLDVTWEKLTITEDAVPFEVTFSDFSTLGDLISFIDSWDIVTCTAIAADTSISPIFTDGYGMFDEVVAFDLAATPTTTVNADILYIMEQVTLGQPDVVLKFHSTFTGNRKMADDDLAYVFLTGGSNGTLSATEWAVALTALEKEDVQVIIPITDDEAVHQMVQDHCVKMSSVTGKNERMCIIGGAWGESKADCEIRAVAQNSEFTMNVHPGGKIYNENGALINGHPYYIAAMIGGIVASVDFNEPLTWKPLNIQQLEIEYTRQEYEELLEKGVCPIYKDEQFVIKVMRQFTTCQKNDIIKNEWSLWRGALMVTKDLRMFMEARGVGKKGTKKIYTALKQDCLNRMKRYVVMGWLAEDPANKTPSFQMNDFQIMEDKIYIEWTGLLVSPINFIFLQNNFTVIGTLAA